MVSSLTDKTNLHLKNLDQLQEDVAKIFQRYEMLKETDLNEQFNYTEYIETIKAMKTQVIAEKSAVDTLLLGTPGLPVIDRVFLEICKITCDSYDDSLDQIAFEVLGERAGVSHFKASYFSEQINIALALLKSRFDDIVNGLEDVDNRIQTILGGQDKFHDLQNEMMALNELNNTMKDAIVLKNKLYDSYLSEKEFAHSTHQELNILQANEVEMNIDMVSWLIKFVHSYQQLILKIITKLE